jgi:DNA/RNA-binding domain of Phe-tRNA-synthetase-like protein
MSPTRDTGAFLPVVGPEIFDLRPDYAAFSVVADGIDNGARHAAVDRYVEEAVDPAARPPWTADHLQAWRTAYRAFGAKPQRTPCSADALLARLDKDGRPPAINAVVDLYNAVSIRYAIPVGGEDVDAYVGHPRLARASGAESFDTMKDGHVVAEAVPQGEVVWMDERGVTCRRWNWRQGLRTRVGLATRRIWFVLERLEPMPLSAAHEATAALMSLLGEMNRGATLAAHLIDRSGASRIG